MTLEEKAEEYVIKNVCENCNHCQSKGYIGCDTYRFAKKTYIDSAKENGIQWHDLEKDPNDLPKNKRKVWCDYDDGYGKGFYDKDDDGWWIEGHLFCSIIIAWCELPTFDKE